MSFGPTTATVIVRGWDGVTRDRHNNKVIGTLDTYELVGCFLQQLSSDEVLEARDSVDTTWVLIAPPLPAGKTIGPEDRIQIDAATAHVDPDEGSGNVATFELFGNPDQLDHIDGAVHHAELILRRAKL